MDSASKEARPRWYKRPSRVIAIVFVMALAIGVPVAWATFIDVPPSNPFYNDINAIQGAGITSGCGGGNFCPTDNIQRQAEAAFVHRGLTRVATSGVAGTSVSPATDTTVLTKTITVGGVSGQTQFLTATATLSLFASSAASCTTGSPVACYFRIDIQVDGTTVNSPNYVTMANGQTGMVTVSSTTARAVSSGTTHTVTVHVTEYLGSTTVAAYGDLTIGTAVFGSTGASTLGTAGAATAGKAPGLR